MSKTLKLSNQKWYFSLKKKQINNKAVPTFIDNGPVDCILGRPEQWKKALWGHLKPARPAQSQYKAHWAEYTLNGPGRPGTRPSSDHSSTWAWTIAFTHPSVTENKKVIEIKDIRKDYSSLLYSITRLSCHSVCVTTSLCFNWGKLVFLIRHSLCFIPFRYISFLLCMWRSVKIICIEFAFTFSWAAWKMCANKNASEFFPNSLNFRLMFWRNETWDHTIVPNICNHTFRQELLVMLICSFACVSAQWQTWIHQLCYITSSRFSFWLCWDVLISCGKRVYMHLEGL